MNFSRLQKTLRSVKKLKLNRLYINSKCHNLRQNMSLVRGFFSYHQLQAPESQQIY